MGESSKLKAACNLSHAQGRALSRFGMNADIVGKAALAIQGFESGEKLEFEVEPLKPDAIYKNRMLYAVKIDGRWVPIVWCKATNSPVTILPAENLLVYPHLAQPKIDVFAAPETKDDCLRQLREIESQISELARQIGVAKHLDSRKWQELKDVQADKIARLKQLKLVFHSTNWPQEKSEAEEIDWADHHVLISELANACKVMMDVTTVDDKSSIGKVLRAANTYLKGSHV